MFEVIGYITVFSVIFGLIVLQYSLMCLGLYKKDLNKIENMIGWVPLLPFILMLVIGFYIVTSLCLDKIKRWVLTNWGWVFIKNKNRDVWARYLRKKYENE